MAPTHRQFVRRRLAAATIMLVLLALIGLGVVAVVGHGGSSRPRATKVSGADKPPPAPPPPEPGGGHTLFPSHRLVAFYGTPGVPALGVLGDHPPDQMWAPLVAAATPYATPHTVVVPSYELIAFAAEATPGTSGNYTLRLSDAQIDTYLNVVRAHGGMLILDIQPGLSGLLDDARTLASWLAQPDVGVALDPEWELSPGQHPGSAIGHTTGGEINQVAVWLQQLTAAHHLPQKLLLIHQFNPGMVAAKQVVAGQPDLATTFDMDGFGPPDEKVSVYGLLAADTRWHLGYKLFYQRDTPLQAPAAVLGLRPPPDVVEYG